MGKFWSRWPARILVGVLAGSFFLFLGIPLVALLIREPPALLWNLIKQPEVLQALQLSLVTTFVSIFLTVLFGLPVAYVLVRTRIPGRRFLQTLVTMPTVLPPVVAGVALLITFGRFGLIGRYLTPLGISIPFTAVAVVMAQMFVSSPFFINSARA
jgi:molybdate transport system permease protein